MSSVVETASSWENIRVESHRFGGQEFKLGNVEIGHIHSNGLVDIPFTRKIREQIVAETLAEPHHILPESGWISFYIREATDIERAIWLLRLSYLQKSLRRNPQRTHELITELNQLNPSEELRNVIA